ncbi:hypothetical protein VTI74DRAFT_2744 [Chaetomium olivicolor]
MVTYSRYEARNLPDYRTSENSDVYSNCLATSYSAYDAFSYNDVAVQRVLLWQKPNAFTSNVKP